MTIRTSRVSPNDLRGFPFALRALAVPATVAVLVAPAAATARSDAPPATTSEQTAQATPESTLVGRAVLPALTFAGPPASGGALPAGTTNGITFPLAEQPVEGFSSLVAGRRHGEYLAMADNGYGAKVNSGDFLIRAYYLTPNFKTAGGGTGQVRVGRHISFRDPDHLIGFAIVNDNTRRRLLTGGDIDPESLQRGRHHDLWVGDEFGPWILHFSSRGRLLDPPYAIPNPLGEGILASPNNPFLPAGQAATQPNSRGLEAMGISPGRRYLYPALEGATVADRDTSRRFILTFDTTTREFAPQVSQYRTEAPGNLVADMFAVEQHRLVVIERDLGSGLTAVFRSVYEVDLRHLDSDRFAAKRRLVDLAAIPDPDLISLPALHEGDLGLGDPYRVTCESVETVYHLDWRHLLVACDNNLPNTGRNPGRADDNEFIVIDVPALDSRS